jgi:hypothetical protein
LRFRAAASRSWRDFGDDFCLALIAASTMLAGAG